MKTKDILPTEAGMVVIYGASRVTVRLAINFLVSHDAVASRQGKGGFVLERVIKHELGEFLGFYEQLQLQGLQPKTDLLRMTIDPLTLPAGASTIVNKVEHIVEFSRRSKINGQAFAEIDS